MVGLTLVRSSPWSALTLENHIFSCMLRCTEKKLDKKNEKLALEIRKRKTETIERKKQILQLKAESEEIISTHHETFEFDDFSMTDESSIIPVRDPRTITSTQPGLDSLDSRL